MYIICIIILVLAQHIYLFIYLLLSKNYLGKKKFWGEILNLNQQHAVIKYIV